MDQTWLIRDLPFLTGTNRDLVKDWRRRGYFQPRDNRGNAIVGDGWQRFSFRDLLFLRVMTVLTEHDFPVSTATRIAERCMPWFGRLMKADASEGGVYALIRKSGGSDEHSFTFARGHDALCTELQKSLLTDAGLPVITFVDLAEILLDLLRRVEEINREQ